MKKILILVDKFGEKKELFRKHISARLGAAEVELSRITDVYFTIDNRNISVEIDGVPITNYDMVYIRRAGDFSVLASTIAVALAYLKVKFVDSTWSDIGPMGSKFTSLVRLAGNHCPIIPTIYFWAARIPENKAKVADSLDFPLIAKETSTQRGKGVHKLTSMADFEKLPMKDVKGRENQYLFQKFRNLGDEFRLLVLGSKVGVWEKKIVTTEGEFRHNVALGAREEFLDIKDIPEDLEKVAVDGARALGLQIAGVDIAVDKDTGKYVLIEVNRGPGFTYDTDISPEMDEIAKYLGEEAQEK